MGSAGLKSRAHLYLRYLGKSIQNRLMQAVRENPSDQGLRSSSILKKENNVIQDREAIFYIIP